MFQNYKYKLLWAIEIPDHASIEIVIDDRFLFGSGWEENSEDLMEFAYQISFGN